MKQKRAVTILVFCIVGMSAAASTIGIFSDQGPGNYEYKSIRGNTVLIYGKGLYQHMSEEVAIQGIAQDYITLFAGIPLLLISLFFALKGSVRGLLSLTGTLGYFFLTYLFYLCMAMYNILFLAYACLMGTALFAFSLTLSSFDINKLADSLRESTHRKLAGGFLIFNAFSIAILWLSLVIPPLLDGSIYPGELEHYTTLIVQGMDLGLFLPLALISGILFILKKPIGSLLAPVYLIFLSILMTALTAKITAMGIMGYNIIPAIVIIPGFNIFSILCAYLLMKDIKKSNQRE